MAPRLCATIYKCPGSNTDRNRAPYDTESHPLSQSSRSASNSDLTMEVVHKIGHVMTDILEIQECDLCQVNPLRLIEQRT